mgnify:CR=1 FL=1
MSSSLAKSRPSKSLVPFDPLNNRAEVASNGVEAV